MTVQSIGVKTTVRIDKDPNAAAAAEAAGYQPAPASQEPEKPSKKGKKKLIVEEGKGATTVAASEAPTQGTVMTQARVEQPPLGNTRIHVQEARQVQEIRDTRTRIRIHEQHVAGVEVAPGVVVHQQAVSSDPHGRTRVTVTGGESAAEQQPEGGRRAQSGLPEVAEPKQLGASKKRRGKRGGKRAKRK